MSLDELIPMLIDQTKWSPSLAAPAAIMSVAGKP